MSSDLELVVEDTVIELVGSDVGGTAAGAAAASATAAGQSAAEALASQTAAAASEANALASKNAASTSAANASEYEGSAFGSMTAAATSEANALASKNASAASEANALASKNAAATSEANASASEGSALASKNAAATSEANALASKNAAATSEGNAATSANAAAASAASVGNGGPNLVFNGSGEVGVLGWSGGPTAISASRDGDGPYLQFAANGASSSVAFVSQAFPVKGGKAHTVQADILADAAATGTYAVDVNYYASADGSGAVLFDGGNANLSAKDGAWHHASGTDSAANVPAGANSARVRLVLTACTWTTLKLRRVKVEQSISASPWSAETTLAAFSPNPPANLSPIFQALQANGTIKSTTGGFVFPDGSTQGVAIGRNRIINGACSIAQRGSFVAGASVSGYGGPDRYFASNGIGAGGQFTQSQGSITYGGITRNAVVQTCNVAVANLAGSAFWSGITQLVEGYNCVDMLGAAAVISFIFNTNVTGTYTVALRDGPGSNSFVSFFNAVANTPTKVSIPVAALPTNLAVGYSGGVGLSVSVGALNQGTFNTATVNSWVAGNFIAASVAANWASAPNNFIALTEPQLEQGPVATPFERRSVAHELLLCQRYYQTDVVTVTPTRGDFYSPVMLKTPMRVTPTVVWYSPTTLALGMLRDNDNGRDVAVTSTAVLSATQVGPLTGSTPAMVVGANTTIGYRVSAEL